jgi:hypothetical protein
MSKSVPDAWASSVLIRRPLVLQAPNKQGIIESTKEEPEKHTQKVHIEFAKKGFTPMSRRCSTW